jgi:hypothetical protein
LKYYSLIYECGKMRPVETVLGMGEGEYIRMMKVVSKFNYDIL